MMITYSYKVLISTCTTGLWICTAHEGTFPDPHLIKYCMYVSLLKVMLGEEINGPLSVRVCATNLLGNEVVDWTSYAS